MCGDEKTLRSLGCFKVADASFCENWWHPGGMQSLSNIPAPHTTSILTVFCTNESYLGKPDLTWVRLFCISTSRRCASKSCKHPSCRVPQPSSSIFAPGVTQNKRLKVIKEHQHPKPTSRPRTYGTEAHNLCVLGL